MKGDYKRRWNYYSILLWSVWTWFFFIENAFTYIKLFHMALSKLICIISSHNLDCCFKMILNIMNKRLKNRDCIRFGIQQVQPSHSCVIINNSKKRMKTIICKISIWDPNIYVYKFETWSSFISLRVNGNLLCLH